LRRKLSPLAGASVLTYAANFRGKMGCSQLLAQRCRSQRQNYVRSRWKLACRPFGRIRFDPCAILLQKSARQLRRQGLITFSADCSASELGAPAVASKKRRASQRRKPLARIGQVSRCPLMSRSTKPVPSGVLNSSAVWASSITMSACLGPRPPASPFSSAIASSSAVTRHPAFFSCERTERRSVRIEQRPQDRRKG
jgi:hypothetical protein